MVKEIKEIIEKYNIIDLYESDYYLINDIIESADPAEEDTASLIITIAFLLNEISKGSTCIDIHSEKENKDITEQIEIFHTKYKKGLYDCIAAENDKLYKPLIIRKMANRELLYFYRYYHAEIKLENILKKRLSEPENTNISPDVVRKISALENIDDEKKLAVYLSMKRNTLLISGGPGTGKTYTASKIVDFFTENFILKHNRLPDIRLTAPTGKAAKRLALQFADKDGKNKFEGQTIHRLLGYNPQTDSFSYNEESRLHADLIIADEISMIDTNMFYSFLSAIDESTSLILIGDKDQLPSVDAGAVLSDLISEKFKPVYKDIPDILNIPSAVSSSENLFTNAVIILKKQNRSNLLITQTADKVRKGDVSAVREIEIVEPEDYAKKISSLPEGVYFIPIEEYKAYSKFISDYAKYYFGESYINGSIGSSADEMLTLSNRSKILTLLREGNYGCNGINKKIHDNYKRHFKSDYGNISGEPVIITSNDYILQLYNGDIGITYCYNDNIQRAYFKSDCDNERAYSLNQLKQYSLAYALTVHKSQGSEYQDVCIILPEDENNPLLTREIIYTGITRAKSRVFIAGKINVFEKAVKGKSERFSGLRYFSELK